MKHGVDPFARVEFNKKAIAARGWLLLTRNLLDHPEIINSAEGEAQEVPSLLDSQSTTEASSNNQLSFAGTLNFNNGFVNTVILDILQNIDQRAVREHKAGENLPFRTFFA